MNDQCPSDHASWAVELHSQVVDVHVGSARTVSLDVSEVTVVSDLDKKRGIGRDMKLRELQSLCGKKKLKKELRERLGKGDTGPINKITSGK